jgi:hypothetical protein
MISIDLKSRGVEPELAKLLSIGDSVKDSYGSDVLIIDDLSISPAKMVTTDVNGYPHLRLHPQLKDLDIKISLNVTKIGSNYYLYDDILLSPGSSFDLSMNNLASVESLITSLEEK